MRGEEYGYKSGGAWYTQGMVQRPQVVRGSTKYQLFAADLLLPRGKALLVSKVRCKQNNTCIDQGTHTAS